MSSSLPHALAEGIAADMDALRARAMTRPLTAADVMTAAEVAALLRVPKSTVEDWARRGIIPSRKIGRRRIYIRSKIEAQLLDDHAEQLPGTDASGLRI